MRADARRNYDKILATARIVFTERGTDSSLDEIAKRAGVGPGTLYRHFPTREALVDALMQDWTDRVSADADAAIATGLPAREMLLGWFEHFIDHITLHRGAASKICAAMDDPASPMYRKCRVMGDANRRVIDHLDAERRPAPGRRRRQRHASRQRRRERRRHEPRRPRRPAHARGRRRRDCSRLTRRCRGMTVDLRIFTEPQQGATYDDLLAVARAAEALGFSGFFRSDHYLAMGGDGGAGPTDAWTTLAGLARETSTIRLGTLVTSATFRLPGPLAIQVAGVDRMSGGRVELGLGAGWFEAEHTAYGIPFPPLGERFDRLEEQLAVITGLWATEPGKTFSHNGTHYPVVDSPALAKPAQDGGVPIIIGGGGKRRTPALAARYAAEFNAPFVSATEAGRLFERVRAVARDAGREPGALTCSAAQVVCVGAATRRPCGGVPTPSGVTSTSCARTAWPARPTRSRRRSRRSRPPAPSASTSRSSTSPTSTTSPTSRGASASGATTVE